MKTDGAIFRSKCQWYENGKKKSNLFLSLEKTIIQKKNMIKLQKDDGTITTDPKEILNMQSAFYSNLYTSKYSDIFAGYGDIITIEECYKTLKTFKNKKSPGYDGLTIEFYRKCWLLFGTMVVNSFNYFYKFGQLSTSQRRAIITLIDKKKDRIFLKNWRPTSLLNADYKLLSKTLSNR